MTSTYVLILFTILMLFGLIGIFIPIIPGVPAMFVLAVLYGIINKFTQLTGREMVFLGFIALASFLVDHLSGVIAAKYGGASKKALWYGFIGTIIGFLVIPPFGSLIGLFIGIIVGEMISGKSHEYALKAAKHGLMGSLSGMAINVLLGILFITLFVVFAYR